MKKIFVRGLLYTIFVMYIAALVRIVLLKYYSIEDVISGGSANFSYGYNLVPFQIFNDYLEVFDISGNWLRGLANIFGNMVIFIPFGLLLPVLFEKMRKSYKLTIIVILCISISFESFQYIFSTGVADIDDVILNVSGGGIGIILYHLITRMMRGNINRIKIAVVILFIVGSMPAYYVAKVEFGNLLGLTQNQIVEIGNEEIPTRPEDVRGTFVEKTANQVDYFNGIKSSNEIANSLLEQKSTKITDSTKVYWRDTEYTSNFSGTETIFTYREMNSADYENLEGNIVMLLWQNENTNEAEVIVFFEVPDMEEGELATTDTSKENESENDNQEIAGMIQEIEKEQLVIGLITEKEFENGGSVAISDNENAPRVVIELTDETKFIRRISTDGVTSTEEQGEFEDLEKEQGVTIIGKQEDGVFIADSVIMWEFR